MSTFKSILKGTIQIVTAVYVSTYVSKLVGQALDRVIGS